MKCLILKLSDSKTSEHPEHIKDGTCRIGEFVKFPEVGEYFVIQNPNGNYFKTSTVRKILSQTTFETRNSIYHFQLLPE